MRYIKDLKSNEAIHCKTEKEWIAILDLYKDSSVFKRNSYKKQGYNTISNNGGAWNTRECEYFNEYTIIEASEFLEINYEIY